MDLPNWLIYESMYVRTASIVIKELIKNPYLKHSGLFERGKIARTLVSHYLRKQSYYMPIEHNHLESLTFVSSAYKPAAVYAAQICFIISVVLLPTTISMQD